MISTVISVYLLTILQSRGLALAAAVGLGAFVGPSQVGARFVEMLIGRHHHPAWTMLVSAILVAIGMFRAAGGIELLSQALAPAMLVGEKGADLILESLN